MMRADVVDQKYPNIELASEYNRRYLETTHRIYVTYKGQRIGSISKGVDHWVKDKTYYSASYRRNSADERGEYIERYNTLFGAKKAIFEKWKENATPERKPYDVTYLTSGDNPDFYPTPSGVAGRMMALVNWSKVNTMLEPSAGKGDLVDYSKKETYNRRTYSREVDTDCIESDQNLRHILFGKGYRVVHDDFLTFNTHKRYDLVLMNPPFSEGDKHLLKALALQQDGGQVVCLLNAETLRNPYTQSRQLLAKRLEELNAKIIYVQGAFARAERRSNVEVAIVYVNIPRREFESEIFARMRRAYDPVMHTHEAKELVGGTKIQQLVSAYEVECRSMIALFNEFNAMSPYIGREVGQTEYPIVNLRIAEQSYAFVNTEAVNRYMRSVRGKYWNTLFRMPELTSKFTSNIMDDYTGSIDRMKDYDFTMFNIQQIISELNVSLASGVHESIMALFDQLSEQHSWYPECGKNIHYFSGWATNKAHKVNKKVILPVNGFYSDYSWNRGEIEHYKVYHTLSDIEKTLDYIDRGVTGDCNLQWVLKQAVDNHQTRNIQCKYFSVTFYKKGTCHITFHEQRIVDVLNIYAARNKNWLPPSYGKVKYSDMTQEEKAVIDAFQGREEYERVTQEPQIYLIEHQANAYNALLLTGA